MHSSKWGLEPIISPITFIKVEFLKTGFTHIFSFRSQVYIHPDDVNKLAESLQVNYDDTSYWIFISTDNLQCFQCKREGHLAKHCPNSINDSQQQIANERCKQGGFISSFDY